MSELLKEGQILGRSELKSIMAGGGNVYCMIGGEQFFCFTGDLGLCLDGCVGIEDIYGKSCGGCAQFPY